MKRVGSLYPLIYTWDNLLLAYWKAARGKRRKPDVILYSLNLQDNLKSLQKSLVDEEPIIGSYRYFKISDPKERTICAASFPERVLHHAIINIVEPYFEKRQIYDSYACRKNKGTESALLRAFAFTRKFKWFLKLDIKKYFDTVDQGILFKLLKSIFKDPQLLKLFYRIIESYRTEKGRGMPIGNLTSQSFANMYLSELDHFIKDSLGIRQYERYMDDICLWGDDRGELGEIKDKAMEFIHSRLNLAAKHIVLNRSAEGVPFLGFLIRPDHIYLLRSKKKRVLKRIGANYHQLTRCHRSQEDFSVHIQPVISHLKLGVCRTSTFWPVFALFSHFCVVKMLT